MYSDRALLNSFEELIPGEPFDEGLMKNAKQGLENLYYNNGKPYVVLTFDYEIEQDTMVVIKCAIKENQTVTIKDMEYVGLKLVKPFQEVRVYAPGHRPHRGKGCPSRRIWW